MAGDSPEAIKKALRLYTFIGILLFVFTGVTVAVATVPWLDFGKHGFDTADAIIGLLIATFKASLVAFIFMHLNHEKKMIYWLFGMGLFFGVCLMAITGWAYADPIKFDGFFDGIPVKEIPKK